MKNIILKYTLFLATILVLGACKDDTITYADVDIIDPVTIDSIGLMANHTMLVADGYAQIDLRPFAYNKKRNEKRTAISDLRLQESFFEYTTNIPGLKLNRKFSTKDADLIGKEITVKVIVKATGLESEVFKFTVIKPSEITETITIPIVFHIAQTTEDIASYGGSYSKDRIDQVIERLNNAFSGIVSRNPNGANTKIVFKAATFGKDGYRLNEAGINRVVTKEITADKNEEDEFDIHSYDNYIVSNNMMWSPERYLNVWLISDKGDKMAPFGMKFSEKFIPHYRNPGATGEPEGLNLVDYDIENDPTDIPFVGGVIYRLQSINTIARSIGDFKKQSDNDLIHYIGRYLGLLPTYSIVEEADDYCEDTQSYLISVKNDNTINASSQKTTESFIFDAENIMDDPASAHRSVTHGQYKRILWVLNNCPERSAWKSNFAFTGK